MGSFHFRGLREINLSKNSLGAEFVENLSKCLLYDSYIRSVDLSFNNIRAKELSELLEQRTISLNANLQNFDVFGNPGTMLEAEGRLITKRIALELLQNIAQHILDGKLTADKGFSATRQELGQDFLYKRSLHSVDVPRRIYSLLGMKFDSALNQASVVQNHKALGDLRHEGAGEQAVVTPTDAIVEEVQRLLEKEWSNTEFTEKVRRPKSSKSRKRQPAHRNSKSGENGRPGKAPPQVTSSLKNMAGLAAGSSQFMV